MKTTKIKRDIITQNSLCFIAFILICFSSVSVCKATVSLPNLFSNGMVLQQKSNASVWGWAVAGQTITVNTSWDNASYNITTDQSGNWKTKITTPTAGGPYIIKFTDDKNNVLTLSSVWIGEVWIVSGQSNPELPVNWDPDYATGDPNNGNYPNIHYFHVPKKCTLTPQNNVASSWTSPTSSTYSYAFAAIPFFFAKNLYNHFNIPIGIIHPTYGSSSQETWLSEDNLLGANSALYALNNIRNGATYAEYATPTGLYNAMFKPLVPYTVKGVCWYQGESNITFTDDYEILLNNFITTWRKELEQPQLPFLITQLAGYSSTPGWPRVQELQFKMSQKYPNVTTVMNYDLGDSTNIHPKNKRSIALRLARAAQQMVYGEDSVNCQGPIVKNITFNGQKVGVSFKNTGTGLVIKNAGTNINNFVIAGIDKVFYTANASLIKSDSIELSSPNVTTPKYVRYAYKAFNSNINLYNSAGLPAVPFRTDTTMNFVSVQSGDWNDTTTWGGVGIPGGNDNVTITTNHKVSCFFNSSSTVNKDFCKNLTVQGTLQISNLQSAYCYLNIYGPIICSGVIEYGQTGTNVRGALINFQANAGLTGTGTANFQWINLQTGGTECKISLPTVNSTLGLSISGNNSKFTIDGASTINATSGTLSVSSSAGQAGNASFIDIYGKFNVSKVYLCNSSTGTIKGRVTVKSNGLLNVLSSLTPVRGAGSVSGTIGGSGCIITVENGGYFNYPTGKNPMDFTVSTNSVYDPNLQVIYNQGSIINGVTLTSTQATAINSISRSTNSIKYNYLTNTLSFSEPFQNFKIYNTMGQLLFSTELTENYISLPSSCKGVCIVRVSDLSEQTFYTKINAQN
jgi:sialate O-acetylesterase